LNPSPHVSLQGLTPLKRYDAAAAQAQKTLDEVVPVLADEIVKLLNAPNSVMWRKLNGMIDELQDATHGMVMV
jgi:hypothetical protein